MLRRSCDLTAVSVITSDGDLGRPHSIRRPATVPGLSSVRVHSVRSFRELVTHLTRVLRRENPEFVYLNSLFDFSYSLVPIVIVSLSSRSVPSTTVVVAPRGELGPGALRIKALKKRTALTAMRHLGVVRHAIWHSTGPEETENIGRVFPGARVLERRNDTLTPSCPPPGLREPGPRRVAYVGRITEKKGFDILLRALGGVSVATSLTVMGGAGPADESYLRRCRQLASALPTRIRVTFLGPVTAELVHHHLAEADVLALPTADENFGHALVEALALGCPVMVPDTTPWSRQARATGTLVDGRGVQEWTDSLQRYLEQDDGMVLAARRTAFDQYLTWASASEHDATLIDLLRGARHDVRN